MARIKRILTAFRLSAEELAMMDAIADYEKMNRSETLRKLLKDKYKRIAK